MGSRVLLAGCLAAGIAGCGSDRGHADPADSNGAAPTRCIPPTSPVASAEIPYEGTLPRPTGPHATGTQIRRLDDPERLETATAAPDDARSVLVQLWYPAGPGPTGADPIGSFMPPAIGDRLVVIEPGWSARVGTHSRLGAPLKGGTTRFPLIIASHGLGSSSRLHTSVFEELASHGYVVAAVEHPHDALLTLFPDGTQTGFDSAAAQALAATPTPASAVEQEALDRKLDAHVQVWVQDFRFVLDTLAALDREDPMCLLTGRLDVDRVGVVGHSFGGAASHEVLHQDPRFDVGVNIDGKPFGPRRLAGGRALTQPFMFMVTEGHLNERPSPLATLDVLKGPGVVAVVSGVEHSGLTDLKAGLQALWGPSATLDELYGTMDGPRAVEIVRTYVLAMFDRTLRGRSVPVLEQNSEAFPEVRLSLPA